MEKLGITRKIDVFFLLSQIEKLAKAKYQDNLEVIQWLKRYIELNGNIVTNYNAEERRNYVPLYSISQAKKALGNPFKANTPLSNNTSFVLNQSMCSVTAKARSSLKPRLTSNK